MDDLTRAFEIAAMENYVRVKQELGLNSTRYLGMLRKYGAVVTVHRLLHLHRKDPPEGRTRLAEKGRLDLSVEALVLRPQFAPFFSEEEIAQARRVLKQQGYRAPWDEPVNGGRQ